MVNMRAQVVSRASSQPSLKHMSSWRSFASHVSQISIKSRESGEFEVKTMQSGSPSNGALDDASPSGVTSPKTIDQGRERREKSLSKDRGVGTRGHRRSSTKSPSGSSAFAKALKKMSLDSLDRYAESQFQHRDTILPRRHVDVHGATRVETPFDEPIKRPATAHRENLPPIPMPLQPDSSSHDCAASPEFDDLFTPPTIPTALLQTHSSSPHRPTPPHTIARRDHQLHSLPPHPNRAGGAPQPSLEDASEGFDLDIFSPCVSHAPVLRGIVDHLPVSPLEMPNPRVSMMTLLDKRPYRSSEKFSSPTSTPISNVEEQTMPSLGQAASNWSKPTASGPTTKNTPDSPARPSSGLHRLPRGSYPPSASSPSIFPASSYANTLPFARRHSAIIRPPVLHSPTPPSLIVSPRSLGTPLIPPGPTSPSRLDTIAGLPPASLVTSTVPLGRRVSDRVRRKSIAVRMGGTGPVSE